MKLDKVRTLNIIKAALKEDIGIRDVTTSNIIDKTESVKASLVVNEDCVLCGIDIAEWIINTIDYSVRFKPTVEDGHRVYKDKEIAFFEGHARAVLLAERTMLNFLSFLSGIATNTNRYVEKVKQHGTGIYDTRKTYPLLRYLEKYAVGVGGGRNHRFGLWDQVLVKENHARISKSVWKDKDFVKDLRNKVEKNIKIEVEVENLKQFEAILRQKPDIIMLDNMSTEDVGKAVNMRKGKKPELEASGSITLENVEEYAKTGVDRISVGSLTHSVRSIDMSLEFIA